MHPAFNNIGAYIAPTQSLALQTYEPGADDNGATVNRTDYGSCTIVAAVGAATGSPTTQDIVFQVEESSDGGSTWAEIDGATITLDADSISGELDLDLRDREADIRVIVDDSASDLSGGSSPTIPVYAAIILGGAKVLPV